MKLDSVIELAGFGFVATFAAFAFIAWPPSVLLVLGLALILAANLRAVRRKGAGKP